MALTLVLKKDIIKKIRENPEVEGKVAQAINVKSASLPRIYSRNDPRLTQKNVLLILSEELNVQEDDLFETVDFNASKATTTSSQ